MYAVALPRKQRPLFPPRCVISGGIADGEALLGAIGMCKFGGFTFSMPAMAKLIKAPVRRRLVFDFRVMSFVRRVGRLLGVFGLIFGIIIVGGALQALPPVWVVIVIAVLFNAVYTVLDTRVFPPAFRMYANQSTVTYQFRSMEYAQEFAMLNGEMGDAMLADLERRYGVAGQRTDQDPGRVGASSMDAGAPRH